MKIEGHLRDYPLPALLEVLADRRESGCLRIAFEPEPATLLFRCGQLVDARISLLQGSAAINLALSMDTAPFDFDNEIVPPRGAIDSHERTIMSRLLGMRLTVEDAAETEIHPMPDEPVTESKPTLVEVSTEQRRKESCLDPASTIRSNQSLIMVPNRGQSLSVDLNQLRELGSVFSNLPRAKLLRIAAVILIVAVPAAVGITVRFGGRMVTTQENATSGQQKPAVDPKSALSPSNAKSHSNSPYPASVEPTPLQTPASIPKKNFNDRVTAANSELTKTVAESEPSKVISQLTNVKEEAGSVPDSDNAFSSKPELRLGKTTKTIVVEIQIDQGRVMGAWVKNSRKGQEAFEAAALRIIRQRRYSRELTGTDTLSVDVTVN